MTESTLGDLLIELEINARNGLMAGVKRCREEIIRCFSEEQQRRKDTENALRRYHTALDDLIEDLCWRQLDGENFNPGLVALIDKACDVLLEPAPGMLAAARAMAEYRRMKATK